MRNPFPRGITEWSTQKEMKLWLRHSGARHGERKEPSLMLQDRKANDL